jgi:transposase
MANGKVYTKEFKENAVRLSMVPGKKVTEVAKDLGISVHSLNHWRRQLRREIAPPEDESLEQQNRRLMRELAEAREEAAVIKKAIA